MNPHHRSEARQVGVADATAAMIHAIQFGGAMESPGRKGSVEDVGEPFKNMVFFKMEFMDFFIIIGNSNGYITISLMTILIWLVVWNMNFMTFRILGMSSSQLTNSYFAEG